jgi:hypothetical protein
VKQTSATLEVILKSGSVGVSTNRDEEKEPVAKKQNDLTTARRTCAPVIASATDAASAALKLNNDEEPLAGPATFRGFGSGPVHASQRPSIREPVEGKRFQLGGLGRTQLYQYAALVSQLKVLKKS